MLNSITMMTGFGILNYDPVFLNPTIYIPLYHLMTISLLILSYASNSLKQTFK